MIGRIVMMYIIVGWLYATYIYHKEKNLYPTKPNYYSFCLWDIIYRSVIVLIIVFGLIFVLAIILLIILNW
jgi:hypothetical protein